MNSAKAMQLAADLYEDAERYWDDINADLQSPDLSSMERSKFRIPSVGKTAAVISIDPELRDRTRVYLLSEPLESESAFCSTIAFGKQNP